MAALSVVGIRTGRPPSSRAISTRRSTDCSGGAWSMSQTNLPWQYFEKRAGVQRLESTLNTGIPKRPRLRVTPSPPWCGEARITTGVEVSLVGMVVRSEEHTSELQSPYVISYA